MVYDPHKVSYAASCSTYYWHHIDPTVKDQQFCDHGNQYRTAIFVHNDEERKLAEESKKKVEAELEEADLHRDRAGRHRSTRPRTITRTST